MPPTEDVPVPLSGPGIALLGTDATTVEGNAVSGNHPTADTPFVGGILLASAASVGGGDPTGTTVRGNTARGNGPADLVYDGSGSGNRLTANRCGTSVPTASAAALRTPGSHTLLPLRAPFSRRPARSGRLGGRASPWKLEALGCPRPRSLSQTQT